MQTILGIQAACRRMLSSCPAPDTGFSPQTAADRHRFKYHTAKSIIKKIGMI
jgi:hypothetical protein